MAELDVLKAIIDGDASGLKAAITSSVGLVDKFKKSASDSAKVFERNFAKSERAAQRLRNSLNPLAAASKRYESAVSQLSGLLKSGTIQQSEYNRMLDLAAQKYLGIETPAQAAARAQEEFARASQRADAQLESLLQSIDPAYAATKRYESAVETLDAALDRGALSQAQYTARIEQARVAMNRASTGGGGMRSFGNIAQQAGYQIGDFAVQVGAGTNAATAFAQQGSQLFGVFGAYGAIAGAALAVTVPLVQAFVRARGEVADFDTGLRALQTTMQDMEEIQGVLKMSTAELRDRYGEAAERVREFAKIQAALLLASTEERLLAQVTLLRDASNAYTSAAHSGREYKNTIDRIERALGISEVAAMQFERALEEAANATDFDEQQAALTRLIEIVNRYGINWGDIPPKIAEALQETIALSNETDRARKLAQDLEAAAAGISFDGAAASAAAVASNLLAAVHFANQLKEVGPAAGGKGGLSFGGGGKAADSLVGSANLGFGNLESGRRPVLDLTPPKFEGAAGGGGGSGGGGGGGGGGTNPIVGQLESLRQALMTQEETQLASFERQQETLQSALEQQLLTRQEYAGMMEDLQRQHSEKMADLSVYKYGDTLQKTGAFFGDLASAFASGNDKMIAMSRKFALAEAAINAARGAAQVLGNPSIPFFAKFAAVAKVMATGAALKQAISSGSSASGAAAAASTSTASTAAPVGPDTIINLRGDTFGRQQVVDLINSINTATENGGQVRLA